VFDDIQDRSPQRNHRPTTWGVWGVDQAINAGLALSSYARLALHGMAEQGVSPGTFLEIQRLLEHTVIDLCRGQYLDIHYRSELPTLEQYLEMVRLKTGALLGTACEVGVLVAGAEDRRETARKFGESLGVGFQLQDDILGVWGEAAKLGKAPNDLEEHRAGLPLVILSGQQPAVARLREEDTSKLYGVLEFYGVRRQAEARTVQFGEMALTALKDIGLSTSWQQSFEGLIEFVVDREK